MTIRNDLRVQLDDDLLDAADVLSGFIERAATKTAEQLGFGYILVPDAPNTFAALTAAFAHSTATGQPLPISALDNADVLGLPLRVRQARQFWHSVTHVRRQLTFSLTDELELALWHLGQLERAGHAPGSTVWQMLRMDLLNHMKLHHPRSLHAHPVSTTDPTRRSSPTTGGTTMSSTGGGSWLDRLIGACFGILLGVIALYCAVKLLQSILPALMVIGGLLALVAFTVGGIVVFRTWRERW